MATTTGRGYEADDRLWKSVLAGGSISEIIVASAALLVAIAGLAGIAPVTAAALATIGVGVALLFEGGAINARFARLLQRHEGDELTTGDVAGGITAELVAGISGIALGFPALFGVAPTALLPSAALVYGVGLLLGCAALTHSGEAFDERAEPGTHAVGADGAFIAATAQLLVGLGGLVIGVAALLGAYPVPLTLAALAMMAWSELVGGVALGTRAMRASMSAARAG